LRKNIIFILCIFCLNIVLANNNLYWFVPPDPGEIIINTLWFNYSLDDFGGNNPDVICFSLNGSAICVSSQQQNLNMSNMNITNISYMCNNDVCYHYDSFVKNNTMGNYNILANMLNVGDAMYNISNKNVHITSDNIAHVLLDSNNAITNSKSWSVNNFAGLFRITTMYDNGNEGVSIFNLYRTGINPTHVVWNEGNTNFDFRIRGQSDNNLFNLVASTNMIGIGVVPTSKLDVNGSTRVRDRLILGSVGNLSLRNSNGILIVNNSAIFEGTINASNICYSDGTNCSSDTDYYSNPLGYYNSSTLPLYDDSWINNTFYNTTQIDNFNFLTSYTETDPDYYSNPLGYYNSSTLIFVDTNETTRVDVLVSYNTNQTSYECPTDYYVAGYHSNGTAICRVDIGSGIGIGDITAVNAGTGLTGGGDSGDVTLNVNMTYVKENVGLDDVVTTNNTTTQGIEVGKLSLGGNIGICFNGTDYIIGNYSGVTGC